MKDQDFTAQDVQVAMTIVNHINESTGVDVETRQRTNDENFDFVARRLATMMYWVDANERLPPRDTGDKSAAYPVSLGDRGWTVAYYHYDLQAWRCKWGLQELYGVTHWMEVARP